MCQRIGDKFFSRKDSLIIGYIRDYLIRIIPLMKRKNIMVASLLYSADKAANTVGHYDAYIKGKTIQDKI